MADVTLRVESVVRGYHIYKEDWSPNIGDIFGVEVEETNIHDRYTVAVVVNDRITGHPPTSQFSTSVKSQHTEFTQLPNWLLVRYMNIHVPSMLALGVETINKQTQQAATMA